MNLRPIDIAEMPAALTLLSEGFPAHGSEYWKGCLSELFAYAERQWDGVIGYIASARERDIGICLAIPSARFAYEATPRKVINLAAFYLRPGSEWMTSLFVRRIMKDPSIEYVDLTASETMRQVVRHLGFSDRTHGTVVVPTMISALQPARETRVLQNPQLTGDALSDDIRSLLEQHEELGAESLAIEVDGELYPMLLVRTSRKRLSGGRIVLARDRELIRLAAGSLSRHLLKRGFFFFEFDSPAPIAIPGSRFATNSPPVQSTGPISAATIDHTFSELVFIPRSNRRQVFANPFRRSNSAPHSPFGLVDASIAAAPSAGLVLGLGEMMPL